MLEDYCIALMDFSDIKYSEKLTINVILVLYTFICLLFVKLTIKVFNMTEENGLLNPAQKFVKKISK